ncbi:MULTISPECIES: aldehyde dehydrogenase [Staphylococcus]|jgi:lactaldehyde dehydrogenase/glycolaldehyde dehydrogenase|uniref:aldehyde dehydrogenase n=1 Tax=Staphylococcus TaxID=1279 RepID=UPI00066E6725|nr:MULTISPECIES: aldehyde dehydrogenase [Staphylococcus]MBE9429969.1 aldehyde dehydrogenase [Staphylococcus epidermidis]MBY6178634.1 aldehyde dehydrogenase [Staphylococcaceae bacterium DP2N0-1]AXV41492.1 glycine betaine aldehyde dehydrogenase [Staphylococcus sp. M0911]OLS05033.1 aldehyde dehydrogenase [Staphylococcus epidermidis]PTI19528.1 aldehyde dehydrogenase [Staphylococcus warneri]
MTNQLFINNEFIESNSNETMDVINPATGEKIDTITFATKDEVNQAIEKSKQAQLEWEKIPQPTRAEHVKLLIPLFEQNKDELAQLYVKEQGKTLAEAQGEIDKSIQFIDYMTSLSMSNKGEVLQNSVENETIQLTKKPIGVTAGIVPWNAPILVLLRKVIPAIVTGCSVIIKPSEETTLLTLRLAQLFKASTIPAGLVQIVPGTGETVGTQLARHKDIQLISLTGSMRAGKAVFENAASTVKKVNLELGGNAPVIVTPNANIDKAVEYIVTARIKNAGQVCTCPERIFVHEDIHDTFVDKVTEKMKSLTVGDPLDDKTDFGAIINETQLNSIDEKVQEAVQNGAKLVLGGHKLDRPGYFYAPTVLDHVKQTDAVFKEEIFGPVLAITTYQNFEQVIDDANDTNAGLSSYIFSNDLSEVMTATERLKFGEVYANCEAEEVVNGYHAGWRESGLGGADGIHGFEEYYNTTVSYIRYQ